MNNIIEFPIRRRRGALRNLKMKEYKERRKMKIVAGIISTVFMVTILNLNLFSDKSSIRENSSKFRGIASVNGVSPIQKRNTVWEKKLASKLAKMNIRKLASVGVSPTLEEKLRVQELEGKYVLNFEKGKISEISFSDNSESGQTPSFINDPKEFIREYRGLMPSDFSSIIEDKSNKSVKKYGLYKNKEKVADVNFNIDNYGRLINMKVHKPARF